MPGRPVDADPQSRPEPVKLRPWTAKPRLALLPVSSCPSSCLGARRPERSTIPRIADSSCSLDVPKPLASSDPSTSGMQMTPNVGSFCSLETSNVLEPSKLSIPSCR